VYGTIIWATFHNAFGSVATSISAGDSSLCMRCNQAAVSASTRRFHDSDSTAVFRNQVILLVPFGYQKPAGAFMRQKCAVSNALCQESSALQRIISAVTYHIPWTERMVELHSAMKASKL
jgi:hypothetical protein